VAPRLHQPVLREPQHCVGVRDDQVVESYKNIFGKIHELGATTVAALMEVSNLIDTDKALVK
jgi:hypothetical protein